MLARISGEFMPSAQGFPTNLTLKGNGMVFTDKVVIDKESHFWMVDQFEMTDISMEQEQKIRADPNSRPEAWYLL